MEAWLSGFHMVFQAQGLMSLVIGTVLGLFFGAVPGLNATLAMVLLLPLTYGMQPASGFGLLMGAYVGGITGGLISAITLGIPGTASSIVTVKDGNPMAKRGESGRALGIASASSFYGGLFSWFALVLLTPQLSAFALKIGPFEYTAVILFGFVIITGLASNNLGKSLLMASIGLIIPTVGLDPLHGVERLTFGVGAIDTGFGLVPLLSGVYVVSRALEESENLQEKYICPPGKIVNVFSQMWCVWKHWFCLLRSAIIGILIGILPGIGASVAPFIAYEQAKRGSKKPEEFGFGSPEGLIASETCNNATIGGALIPALALGIPGDVPVVILLSGLMLHGFQPGPLFFSQNQDMAYATYICFFLANLFMIAFLMLVGIRIFTRMMSVSKIFLIPMILVAGLLGAYNVSYSMTDVWIALFAGIVAYCAIKADFPLTPMIIAVILGPMLESNLRIALTVSSGSLLPLVTQPISLLFVLLTFLSLALILRKNRKERKEVRT